MIAVYLILHPRVLVCLVLLAAFTVLVGAALSSVFRHTAVATTAAYSVVLALCAGTLLFWLGRDAPFGAELLRT